MARTRNQLAKKTAAPTARKAPAVREAPAANNRGRKAQAVGPKHKNKPGDLVYKPGKLGPGRKWSYHSKF